MSLKLSTFLLSLVVTCSSFGTTNNYYLGANAGLGISNRNTGSLFDNFPNAVPLVVLTGGYRLNNNISFALDGIYRRADISNTNTTTGQVATASLTSYSALFNVLYNFKPLQYKALELFMGGGAGYSYNQASDGYVTPLVGAKTKNLTGLNTHKVAFQVLGGVGFNIKENIAITSDIRWIYLNSFKFVNTNFTTTPPDTPSSSSVVLTLGAKFRF